MGTAGRGLPQAGPPSCRYQEGSLVAVSVVVGSVVEDSAAPAEKREEQADLVVAMVALAEVLVEPAELVAWVACSVEKMVAITVAERVEPETSAC